MFARFGDVSVEQYSIRKVVFKVPDAQVMSDLDATVAWQLRQLRGINNLGITGFAGVGGLSGCIAHPR